MEKPLQLKVTMMPASRRADGSVTLKLISQEELSTEQFAHIDEYRQVNGWLLFGPNRFSDADLPKESAVVEGGKTPSQRLRAHLYVLHRERGGTPAEFPAMYEQEMSRIINKVKEALSD